MSNIVTSALHYIQANSFLTSLLKTNSRYIGLALDTTIPQRDGSGITEPSGNGYARILVSTDKWTTPDEGHTSNNIALQFPEATGAWGTCHYLVIFSDNNAVNPSTANSNVVAYAVLVDDISPENQQIPIIRVGQLTVSM